MVNKKNLVQIGAGKIGRGYIADLFTEGGFTITFLDYSDKLVDALRTQGYYTNFKHHSDGTYTKQIIKGYKAFCTETEYDMCVKEISEASYISTNIFPGAVDSISHMLADAIEIRAIEDPDEPMDILIGVNFLYGSRLFSEGINKYLKTDNGRDFFTKNVALAECLVHRNGAFPTEEMLKEDPLSCNSGDTPFMTVDNILKNGFPENVGLKPLDNVPAWMIHKIWVANMSHSLGGYIGKYRGYTYIGECRDDAGIMKHLFLAKKESVFAMHEEWGMSYEVMEEHDPIERQKAGYLNHKANSVDKDTIDRVCGDLTRKIAKGDRLIGPALACVKHGKLPYFLSRGAAYAYHFFNENDPTTIKVRDYIKENGIEKAVTEFSGLRDEDKDEKLLKDLIVAQYYDLSDLYPFDINY